MPEHMYHVLRTTRQLTHSTLTFQRSLAKVNGVANSSLTKPTSVIPTRSKPPKPPNA